MCKIRSEENKDNYKRKRNQTRKIVSRTMRKEAEQEMCNLYDKPNNAFKLVKFLKQEGQVVNGGQCLRKINGKFVFSEKDRKRYWKENMQKTMSKENS